MGVLPLVFEMVGVQVVSVDTRGKKAVSITVSTSASFLNSFTIHNTVQDTYAGMQMKRETFFQFSAAAGGNNRRAVNALCINERRRRMVQWKTRTYPTYSSVRNATSRRHYKLRGRRKSFAFTHSPVNIGTEMGNTYHQRGA